MNSHGDPPQAPPHVDPNVEAKLAALKAEAAAEVQKRKSARLAVPSGQQTEPARRRKHLHVHDEGGTA